MNSTVKTIFIILISGGVFTLLLNLLKKNNPEIFYFIKKIPEPWKGKWFIRWIGNVDKLLGILLTASKELKRSLAPTGNLYR